MPNYCDYEMKIRGSKSAIQRVVDCLKANYNYSEGKPEHKHFFRVFEAEVSELVKVDGEDNYEALIWGYCAWSVYSCMCKGEHTYYDSLEKDYPDLFMGTNLEEQSKDCTIEVFSEEEGIGFSEHYLFENGQCLIDDCCDIEQAGYTKTGKITTRINWDTYDGDTVCINPHRKNPNEGYRWEI
jgi:hypothetical protein